MRWGGATAPATAPLNGLVTGPAPGDSMSLQRQPTCAAVGAPTANAVNATIPCPPPMGDAGVGGDGGTTNPGSDDDGCSVGASPGGFALVGMTALVLFGVRRRRR